MPVIYRGYSSIGAYLTALDAPPQSQAPRDSVNNGARGGQWTKYEWEESQQAARTGSTYHRERVIAMRNKLIDKLPTLSDHATDVTWDVAPGLAFDMARVLEDTPEQWFSFAQRDTDELTIVFNGTVSCGVEASTVERAGAAVAALADILQSRGIGVRVIRADCFASHTRINSDPDAPPPTLAECTRKYGRHVIFTTAVTVQQPDSPVDPDALAYWIGSSDSFRRQGFRAVEVDTDPNMEQIYCGYGYPASLPAILPLFPALRDTMGASPLVISNDQIPSFKNDSRALEWLETNARRYLEHQEVG